MTISYHDAIFGALAQRRHLDLADNFDPSCGRPETPPSPAMWRQGLGEAARRLKAADPAGAASSLADALAYYLAPRRYYARHAAQEIERGGFLYESLADEPSKALLVQLIAYRILGHRKVRLPLNTPQYWADITRMNTYSLPEQTMWVEHMKCPIALKDLRPMGYDIRCYAGDGGLACLFVQKQYEYRHGDVHCRVEPGDVVMDAGGCWGETALYFAHEAGPNGKVATFEFIPSNLAILKANLALNPDLGGRVAVVERPLWDTQDKTLAYVDWGPGSQVTDEAERFQHYDALVQTTTIDGAVAALDLPRVDFIKMDIEGAEMAALRGAEAMIRRCRPKLAISLYHRDEDFDVIPRYLAGLELGYRFYLGHHTIYRNETVLFAVPPERGA